MDDCLFCKIAGGSIPTNMLYEDEDLVAFRDIDPQAPLHILLVPKQHIPSAQQLTEVDAPLLGKVFEVAAMLYEREGLTEGYRLVTNVGKHGGQSVPHLHFHLLAGRQMAWPPG